MKHPVTTRVSSTHTVAVEWEWANTAGWRLVGPAGSPPPSLIISVTQLDPCEETLGREMSTTEVGP